MQGSNTGQTITWKLYSQVSWYFLICSCSNAYINVSRRTLHFLTSLHRILIRISVNQNRFRNLLESHWARQIDQKNHRLFETNIQKTPFIYMRRITTIWMSQQLVTILKYPAFLFLAALISSQRHNAVLTGKVDAINLSNHNVQITPCKAYLQETDYYFYCNSTKKSNWKCCPIVQLHICNEQQHAIQIKL